MYIIYEFKVYCIMKLFFFIIIVFVNISQLARAEAEQVFIIDIEKLTAKKKKFNIIGNKEEGKKLFISRKVNCLSCHVAPIDSEKFQGNFGPALEKIGSRYTKDELRLRIINPKVINPDTIMPSYFIKIQYPRVAKKYFNKTIISPQEVENLVEYLYSLK